MSEKKVIDKSSTTKTKTIKKIKNKKIYINENKYLITIFQLIFVLSTYIHINKSNIKNLNFFKPFIQIFEDNFTYFIQSQSMIHTQ